MGPDYKINREQDRADFLITGVFQRMPDEGIVEDVKNLLQTGIKALVLDLGTAEMVTSMGIRTLFLIQDLVIRHKASLKIKCSNPEILDLLKNLNVYQLFDFVT